MIDPADRVVRAIARRKTLATLPLEYTRLMRRFPFFFVYLPFIAFTTWTLELQERPPVTRKGKSTRVDLWAPRVVLSVAD